MRDLSGKFAIQFVDNARAHACYNENGKPSRDAEWLLFNARSIIRSEQEGNANDVLFFARQRQQFISGIVG